MIASKCFVDCYFKGKGICAMDPAERSKEELELLQEWLLERSDIFKTTTRDGLHKVCKHASLKVVKHNQLVYQQEDIVDSFYVILRGSVSLMSDPQFRAKQLAAAQSALNNQIVTNPGGQRRSISAAPSKLAADRKVVAKSSLGIEIETLRAGDCFGQEALLQKSDTALFSAVANDHTELLIIDSSVFEEVFLAKFEADLYGKALYFSNFDLFSGWSPYLIRQIALSAKEVNFHSGECLFRQGMAFSNIFILKSGSVKLSSDCTAQSPNELLSQIIPPKDYLSDILAEASIGAEKSQKPKRPKTAGHSPSTSINASTASLAFHSQLRPALRRAMSAPPLKQASTQKPIMGFRLQEPRPCSTCQLCCLGPGDMLNHIETLCNVKHSLFNAVAVSDTVVYSVNAVTLMQLLERKPLHTLHSLTDQVIQRVQAWKNRKSCILLFEPLLVVLQQSMDNLMVRHGRAFNSSYRKCSQYSPEKRAYVAVKNLGKNYSTGFDKVFKYAALNESSKVIVAPTSTTRKFLIRQLTQKSLDNGFGPFVTKEHTSFDSPLPKNCITTHYSIDTSTHLSQTTLPDIEERDCSGYIRSTTSAQQSYFTHEEVEGHLHLQQNCVYGSDYEQENCIKHMRQRSDNNEDNTCTSKPQLEDYAMAPGSKNDSSRQQVKNPKLSDYRYCLTIAGQRSSVHCNVMNMRQTGMESTQLYLEGIALMHNQSIPNQVSRRSYRHSPIPRPPVNLSPNIRPYYL